MDFTLLLKTIEHQRAIVNNLHSLLIDLMTSQKELTNTLYELKNTLEHNESDSSCECSQCFHKWQMTQDDQIDARVKESILNS